MPLTYGIDIHGTLACRKPDKSVGASSLYPLLAPLMMSWVKKGETVYVLSGPPQNVILSELAALGLQQGVHFHQAFSMVDYMRGLGTEMWENPPGSNHWWADKAEWNRAKGLLAKHHGIDIIIDDTVEYGPHMPESTEFVLVVAHLL